MSVLILTYHSVTPRVIDPLVQVSPRALARHLEWVRKAGCTLDTVEAVCAAAEHNAGGSPRVAVTFDDGYEDFSRHALPVLKKLCVPTVLFVCPAHLGGWNDWSRRNPGSLRVMCVNELRRVRREGVQIQAHGWSHESFLDVGHRLPDQLEACIRWFKQELAICPHMLAYPFGEFHGYQLPWIAERFRYAFAMQGPIPGNPYAIPRVALGNDTGKSDILRIVNAL